MNIELKYRGLKFDIYVIVLNDGSRPAIDFLEQLKQDDFASFKSLVSVYTMHADHGPLLNETKSRLIKGYDNLYEFKTKQGARLTYFYMHGGKTIITHGFQKGAPAKAEFKKARLIKDLYIEEVKHG